MTLPFPWTLVLAALSGVVALAYEIVWARLYSFASGAHSQAFGAMLGSYLVGLAVGSLVSARWQEDVRGRRAERLMVLSRLVLAANVLAFLVVPAVSWLLVGVATLGQRPLLTLPLVALAASLQGTVLPLLCHYGIEADDAAGARVSFVYLANIIGSGAGSLLTGFLLMDRLRLGQINGLLLFAGLVLSAGLARLARAATRWDRVAWLAAVGLLLGTPWLHDGLLERLFYKQAYQPDRRFDLLLESRHGIISVDADLNIYGGGLYDGTLTTGLTYGSALVRPYFLSALHPHPREVLVIGVSGGAWTQILAHNPAVEELTAVEISRSYLEVIPRYPGVSSLLRNPKVRFVIDDGRRWLRRNPARRFDAIVMNTTVYWREFSSALLSTEYLELVRDHLKPGGIAMWNCTNSVRARRTALEVFPHAMMVMNAAVGSLRSIEIDRGRWRDVLERYAIDGVPVFDLSTAAGRQQLDDVLTFGTGQAREAGWTIEDSDTMRRRYGSETIITDDNLGDEYAPALRDRLRAWMTRR